jgi:hypothetical protein
MTVKILNQKIKHMSQIKIIEELLHGIIGEICWDAHLGYGDELQIEIGDKVPDPIILGKETGLWTFGSRASKWKLVSSTDRYVTSEDDLRSIKQSVRFIDGNRIMAFNVYWPKLTLEIVFHTQLKLEILPVWMRGSKLAHWEFFMPNSMFLKVGPKATWSYYRSDIPIP